MKKLLALALLLLGAAASGSGANPGRFDSNSNRIDNPWFPLLPGSTYVYHGVKDGKAARDVLTVTSTVTTIQGVHCATIHDRLYLNGRLGERTTDWYAQDRAGNVWYYGESTAELDAKGKVTSTEGTWLTGRNGAQPGIYMPGNPHVGQSGRQEYYKGHAEDHFQVLQLAGIRLLTKEWTPLEPGVLDHKLYKRGVGTVREEAVKGPIERLVLVSFRGGA